MSERLHHLMATFEQAAAPGELRSAGDLISTRDGGMSALPTGIAALDGMTAFGGIPRGRLTEFVGGPSSGKTLVAHRLLAAATRDGSAVYLDLACSFCPPAASAAGVDLRHVMLIRPRTPAETLEAAATFVRSGGIDLLLWDGAERAFAPRAVERLALYAARSGVALVFVSTISPNQHLGGTPLDFALALQIQMMRTAWFYGHPSRLDEHALHGWQLDVEVLKAKAAVAASHVSLIISTPPAGGTGTADWAGVPRWRVPGQGGGHGGPANAAPATATDEPARQRHAPLSIDEHAPRWLRRVTPPAVASQPASAARAAGEASRGG